MVLKITLKIFAVSHCSSTIWQQLELKGIKCTRGNVCQESLKSLYAVFSVMEIIQMTKSTKLSNIIYNVWLPNSEYCLSDELCADFEYYDERWNCQSASSQMDIYIPIKKIVD